MFGVVVGEGWERERPLVVMGIRVGCALKHGMWICFGIQDY